MRFFNLPKILFFSLAIFFIATPALWAETKILVLGDSLTAGYGVQPRQAYPYLLEQKLQKKLKGIRVINAGVSGSTSASALGRVKWFLRSKPDIMILALGGNDGLRGLSSESMRENLSKAIRLAKKNSIFVILAGMQIPPNYGPKYTRQFEQVFPELSKKYSIPLIPFLLEGVAGDSNLNLPDGIHPNAKGHVIIARMLEKFLQPFLLQVKSE